MSLNAKLKSRRGVTMTELLVALVILSLLSMAVSVGISAGIQTYRQSTTLSRTQSLLSTLSKSVADELRYARDIDPVGVSYTSQLYGEGAVLSADANGRLIVTSQAMGVAELVGSGTYGEYKVGISLSYGADCFKVELTIWEDGAATPAQTQTVFVRALNPA